MVIITVMVKYGKYYGYGKRYGYGYGYGEQSGKEE